jgi:hypothetical protein
MVGGIIIGGIALWIVSMLGGCSTKITYGDFTYEKPLLSSQEIDHLEVYIDPNTGAVTKLVMDGQKSDAQAALKLADTLVKGGAGAGVVVGGGI